MRLIHKEVDHFSIGFCHYRILFVSKTLVFSDFLNLDIDLQLSHLYILYLETPVV